MNFADILETLQLELPTFSEIPKLAVFGISVLMAVLVGCYTPKLVGSVMDYCEIAFSNPKTLMVW